MHLSKQISVLLKRKKTSMHLKFYLSVCDRNYVIVRHDILVFAHFSTFVFSLTLYINVSQKEHILFVEINFMCKEKCVAKPLMSS